MLIGRGSWHGILMVGSRARALVRAVTSPCSAWGLWGAGGRPLPLPTSGFVGPGLQLRSHHHDVAGRRGKGEGGERKGGSKGGRERETGVARPPAPHFYRKVVGVANPSCPHACHGASCSPPPLPRHPYHPAPTPRRCYLRTSLPISKTPPRFIFLQRDATL